MTNSSGSLSSSARPAARLARGYLIRRNQVGHGSIYELDPSRRMGIGRSSSNSIVINDEGCSRFHAEIYYADGRWRIGDLGSLNGTRVNDHHLTAPTALSAGDRVTIGQAEFLFVEDLSELRPQESTKAPSVSDDRYSILHRQNQTQSIKKIESKDLARNRPSYDLQTLYRLGLRMAGAKDAGELADIVLNVLLDTTAADSGSILRMDDIEPVVLAQGTRGKTPYSPPPEGVLKLVCSVNEAVLAKDESPRTDDLSPITQRTMICAPVTWEEEVIGVLYLYTSDPLRALSEEDLNLTVAVGQQFGSVLHTVERQASLSTENEQLRESLRVETEIIGQSPAIRCVLDQVGMVAPTDATVLIRGASGVGKELVARSIHYSSRRREGQFVCLNCAALPETLLESELFGHEKGAFTGATDQKKGKFEVAHKGTIFLDEIGEMSLATQSKFLRVLEGHPFERIGGDKPIRAHVRVVAATNRDLEKAVAEGKFRNDLYYRLQVVEIHVPPLADRKGDVELLANHYLMKFAREMGRRMKGFTPEAMAKLTTYRWPGNVRELRNVVERTVVLTRSHQIQADDIWLSANSNDTVMVAPTSVEPLSLEQMEAEHIRRTLTHTNWNKSQAAAILGIERSTLDRKIKRYAIADEG